MVDIIILGSVLFTMLILFVWGYWRYDLVAVMGLMTITLFHILPFSKTFSGLSNPAVITVACVMIITNAITQTGIINTLVEKCSALHHSTMVYVTTLCAVTACLSAFMNNVGALALMMPIAIKTAEDHKCAPALILMPLAFSSVLGGLTTAIGTPPNLLISTFRGQLTGQTFNMFDFTPVGLLVATTTVLFIGVLGWRLTPQDRKSPTKLDDLFQIHDYISEVTVPEDSPLVGKTRQELEEMISSDFLIIGLIRKKKKKVAVHPHETFEANDILIIEAPHDDLNRFIEEGKCKLATAQIITASELRGDEIGVLEVVVPQGSRVEGRSVQRMRLRSRFHINLLAIARKGRAFKNRLDHVNFRAGDIVLLQGEADTLQEMALNLGFLPLVRREIQVGTRQNPLFPIAIFATAIGFTTLQILPVEIAFMLAVIALVLFKMIPIRNLYDSIDWPIIVLLAAVIPFGTALQITGSTDWIAGYFAALSGQTSVYFIIALLLIITMTLSDVMNNAATAVVMAPIGVSIAQALQVNIDPFLMAVAVGASCSFLTPISHQNNTLIMGPGGYKFYDYLKLGLAIEVIVILVGLPMILWVWPL